MKQHRPSTLGTHTGFAFVARNAGIVARANRDTCGSMPTKSNRLPTTWDVRQARFACCTRGWPEDVSPWSSSPTATARFSTRKPAAAEFTRHVRTSAELGRSGAPISPLRKRGHKPNLFVRDQLAVILCLWKRSNGWPMTRACNADHHMESGEKGVGPGWEIWRDFTDCTEVTAALLPMNMAETVPPAPADSRRHPK